MSKPKVDNPIQLARQVIVGPLYDEESVENELWYFCVPRVYEEVSLSDGMKPVKRIGPFLDVTEAKRRLRFETAVLALVLMGDSEKHARFRVSVVFFDPTFTVENLVDMASRYAPATDINIETDAGIIRLNDLSCLVDGRRTTFSDLDEARRQIIEREVGAYVLRTLESPHGMKINLGNAITEAQHRHLLG